MALVFFSFDFCIHYPIFLFSCCSIQLSVSRRFLKLTLFFCCLLKFNFLVLSTTYLKKSWLKSCDYSTGEILSFFILEKERSQLAPLPDSSIRSKNRPGLNQQPQNKCSQISNSILPSGYWVSPFFLAPPLKSLAKTGSLETGARYPVSYLFYRPASLFNHLSGPLFPISPLSLNQKCQRYHLSTLDVKFPLHTSNFHHIH